MKTNSRLRHFIESEGSHVNPNSPHITTERAPNNDRTMHQQQLFAPHNQRAIREIQSPTDEAQSSIRELQHTIKDPQIPVRGGRRRSENDALLLSKLPKPLRPHKRNLSVVSQSGVISTEATFHRFYLDKLGIQPSAMRILVVESSPKCGISVCLRLSGYEQVTTFAMIDQAKSAIKVGTGYDLVIMDLQHYGRPQVEEFISYVASISAGEIPCLVAVYADEIDRADVCLQAGADDFLLKPVVSEAIKNSWRNIWRKRKQAKLSMMTVKELHHSPSMENTVNTLEKNLSARNIEAPIDFVVRSIANILQSDEIAGESKKLLSQVLFTMKSTLNLYHPDFARPDGGTIDPETRTWLSKELFNETASRASDSISSKADILEISPYDSKSRSSSVNLGWRTVPYDKYSSDEESMSDVSRDSSDSSRFYLEQSPRASPAAPRSRLLPPPLLIPHRSRHRSRTLGRFRPSLHSETPRTSQPLTPFSVCTFADAMRSRAATPASSHSTSLYVLPPIVNTFKQDPARLEILEKWDFDVWAYTNSELITFLLEMFHSLGFVQHYNLEIEALVEFLRKVTQKYQSQNPYHNFYHAFDVTHAGYLFLCGSDRTQQFDSPEQHFTINEKFSFFLACICHDLMHDGKSNNFHTATESHLAIRYNDRSVLENHHAYETFRMLYEIPEINILNSLAADTKKEIRALMIKLILATDLGRHMEVLEKLRHIVKGSPEDNGWDWSNRNHRELSLELLIKCSDISNSTRPQHLAKCWSDLVQEEMFMQGDEEKRLGLAVSAFSDRDNNQQPGLGVTFADFIVLPLFQAVSQVIPSMSVHIRQILVNREFWQKKKDSDL